MNTSQIKNKLERLYKLYNKKKYVHPDPLEFLYSYQNIKDREIAGLIASSLAYGNVKQILKSVSKVLEVMQPSPSIFLKNSSYNILEKTYKNFRHRFADGKNLASLLFGIKRVIKEFGSLNKCFLTGIKSSENSPSVNYNIIKGMSFLVSNLSAGENKPGHLIPPPEKGSACKRMNLFLRWMIRKDDVDPGGWEQIPLYMLIIPLDTHMHKISLALGFTKRKTANIKTALEITSCFKAINPKDPVKYDFALTRFGIRDDMNIKNLYIKHFKA